MIKKTPEVNPTAIVEANFPRMLNEGTADSLTQALTCAEYLNDNSEIKDSALPLLVNYTNRLREEVALDERNPLEEISNPLIRSAYRWADSRIKDKTRSLALLAFSDHRIETSESISMSEIENNFLLAVTQPRGFVIKGAMRELVKSYCKKLARKEDITPQELLAIKAGRTVLSQHSSNIFAAYEIAGPIRMRRLKSKVTG